MYSNYAPYRPQKNENIGEKNLFEIFCKKNISIFVRFQRSRKESLEGEVKQSELNIKPFLRHSRKDVFSTTFKKPTVKHPTSTDDTPSTIEPSKKIR